MFGVLLFLECYRSWRVKGMSETGLSGIQVMGVSV